MTDFSDYNVLIAEDCDVTRELVKEIITGLGFNEIHVVSNGLAATEILKSHPIHIVISDWDMPEMDGIELLRYVRNRLKVLVTRFIMITAKDSDDKVQESLAFGVDAHIAKPINAQQVAQSITVVIDEMQADHSEHVDQLSVLLVDDNESILMIISDLLQLIGVTVIEQSNSVAQAQEKLSNGLVPDVVMCDWRFPEGDGLELLKWIRQQPTLSRVPFIMATAERDPEKIREALASGVTEFLVKPFHQEELARKLIRATQHA